MSGLFNWSSTQFDKLLDKATSHMLLEPDWDAVLQICDCIRQDDVQPKYAISCIKKKLYAQNPHVVLYTLQVLESIVKNCGAPVHAEIATRAFMEELREIVKSTTNDNVKNRILELIQGWAHGFRNEPKYTAVNDMCGLLRVEGYKFQAVKESDAMFAADTAPDWAVEDCCHRCRVQFTVILRKHHCRNCGHTFCNQCSSRTSPIPRFGIEKEVRVCEACWENLKKPVKSAVESSPKQNSKSPSSAPSTGKTDQELKEEEELQLALALSQSEAESKSKPQSKGSSKSSIYASSLDQEPSSIDGSARSGSSDAELDRYLNRSYWEQRQQKQVKDGTYATVGSTTTVTTSALPAESRTSPVPSAPVSTTLMNTNKMGEKYQNGDIDEMEDFITNMRTALEIFINRMKSNLSRGRPIATDTFIQSQFINITNMHSQLLKYIQEQDDLRAFYERLQDKLNQVRDARAALDALREEHREKLRQEAEEAERLRQIQMAQKLEIMRKKKHEYLQYQRQMAIQRMQEQEREMHMRHEQQKQQQYQQVVQHGQSMPPGPYPTHPQQYMPPASQGYSVGIPSADTRVSMPMPHAQQSYATTYAPNQAPVNGHPHMQAGDYPQPYNMQGMAGALPPVGAPFPQQPPPHHAVIPSTSVAPNPMMMQHRMMGPALPPHMMQQPPPPQMGPVMSNMPPHVAGMMVGHPMVPGHALAPPESVQPIPLEEKESEPLIVFD